MTPRGAKAPKASKVPKKTKTQVAPKVDDGLTHNFSSTPLGSLMEDVTNEQLQAELARCLEFYSK